MQFSQISHLYLFPGSSSFYALEEVVQNSTCPHTLGPKQHTTSKLHTGSSSFYALEEVVQDLMGFKHVLPEHQVR